MSAIFLPEDVCELLKGKTVVYIGDSVQRSMYKDLVLLFQDKRYLTDQELRAKGELCFLGDELMEGGRKGEMSNSTKYREVRKYLHDSQTKVLYFFITACFGEYIDMLLKKLRKPDIIFMNSCLWDVHRYGTKGYEGYGPNLVKLVKLIKELHPDILFAWTTTPPVDIRSKAGFLEDRKDFVKINEVLRCNDIARGVMKKEGIPVADFADVFRHFTHHRANDGVHWNEKAHRRMTNILLETVARHFKHPVPRPISDDFGRLGDFADRPPFPHSFSQPAFHHNNSWGSFDEERWNWDSYSRDYYRDDFISGLDYSYGGGNYSYFEGEEDMSPRFMPPPGRHMQMDGHGPPSMRPPQQTLSGYRFGTSDPIQMREGRKRKARGEEGETTNKRTRLEKARKSSTGSEGMVSSPLVEDRPPLRVDGSDNRTFARLDSNENAIMSKGDGNLAAKEGDNVGLDEPANIEALEEHSGQPELVAQSVGKAVDYTESSVMDERPCIMSDEIDANDGSLRALQDEKGESADGNTTSSQETTQKIRDGSVFAKLSATTSKILESIMKPSKSIGSSLSLSAKKPDDKARTSTSSAIIESSKPSPDGKSSGLQVSEATGNATHEEKPATESSSGETEAASSRSPEADQTGSMEVDNADISFYDIEDNLEDSRALLNKSVVDEEKMFAISDQDVLKSVKDPSQIHDEKPELTEKFSNIIADENDKNPANVPKGAESQSIDLEGSSVTTKADSERLTVDQRSNVAQTALGNASSNSVAIFDKEKRSEKGLTKIALDENETGNEMEASEQDKGIVGAEAKEDACVCLSNEPRAQAYTPDLPNKHGSVNEPTPVSTSVTMTPNELDKTNTLGKPGVVASSNISQVASATEAVTSSLESKQLLETKAKPKLPCFPNRPSLDMKSPFFKPKAPNVLKSLTVVTATTSVPIVKNVASSALVSSPKVLSPSLNTQSELKTGANPPVKLGVTKASKGVSLPGTNQPDVKSKKKKIKKNGKKIGKKGKAEESGELKQKVKKVAKKSKGKLKKKKIKKKKKAILTGEVTVIDNAVTPHTIATVAATDRQKNKTPFIDTPSRNRQFPTQTSTPSHPSMHAMYRSPTPQYQQQVLGSQYMSNYAMSNAQPQMAPQNVTVQPYQYGQQLYVPQVNQLGFAPQYVSSPAATLYPPQKTAASYQGFGPTYYADPGANQTNNLSNDFSLTSTGQPKEYAHLAWL